LENPGTTLKHAKIVRSSHLSLVYAPTKPLVKYLLKKKKYYTSGIQKYIRKWGLTDPETMKQISIRYRLMGVFVEKGKWKKLVRHPLFAIAMCYLRFRVALAYLLSRT
jgi:hypothetical protein